MSDKWERYEKRMTNNGIAKRPETFKRETHWLQSRLRDSLSYHTAIVDDEERQVAIINSDNLNEKLMFSMPGEDFKNGGIVEWMDNHWTIVEKDANNELYTKVKLLQCNYLLKWIEVIDDEPTIIEQWCTVDDGTKYMTGVFSDRLFITEVGDTRIAITIQRNEHTAKMIRQTRILVDDPLSDRKMAFDLTKPLKVGWRYNEDGVYKFVLSECNTTDYDNFELMIPDYYKYFPREDGTMMPVTEEKQTIGERSSWI